MRLNRIILCFAVCTAVLGAGAFASAQTVTLTSVFGTSNTASLTNYSLVGNTFTFTVTNTSGAGTITGIGFDLSGDRPNYTLISASNPNFTIQQDVAPDAGASQVGVTQFDFALLTGSSFQSGDTATGILPGASATFSVSGDFSGLTADAIAQSAFARLEGVPANDTLAGNGRSIPATPPPQIDASGTIASPSGSRRDAQFFIFDVENEQVTPQFLEGSFGYVDKKSHISFITGNIQTVTIHGNQGIFTGTTRIGGPRNKQNVTFTVAVTANEGATPDTFSISLSNGYSASGNLTSGRIVIHTLDPD